MVDLEPKTKPEAPEEHHQQPPAHGGSSEGVDPEEYERLQWLHHTGLATDEEYEAYEEIRKMINPYS